MRNWLGVVGGLGVGASSPDLEQAKRQYSKIVAVWISIKRFIRIAGCKCFSMSFFGDAINKGTIFFLKKRGKGFAK